MESRGLGMLSIYNSAHSASLSGQEFLKVQDIHTIMELCLWFIFFTFHKRFTE